MRLLALICLAQTIALAFLYGKYLSACDDYRHELAETYHTAAQAVITAENATEALERCVKRRTMNVVKLEVVK